jgi:hypothetical protein
MRAMAAIPAEHPYDAPRVEAVLTPDALAREIQYAGNGPSEVLDEQDALG